MTGRRVLEVPASLVLVVAVVVTTVGAATVRHRLPTGVVAAAAEDARAPSRPQVPEPTLIVAARYRPVPVPAPEPAPEPPPEPSPGPSPEVTPEPVVATGPDPAAPRPGDVAGRTGTSVMPLLDLEAVAATATRTGVPARALAAYASATLRVNEERPGCNLSWITLAGIGWVESQHGSYGGARLLPDGSVSRPIIGPALDGGPGVRAIGDTDGGRLDGDTTWDRAVGPMQFIPTTWARWGSDANGDGTADPQHIDDAALAAARYLCANGGDLRDSAPWARAVRAYNHSDAYVRAVLHAANVYADRANG